MPSNYDFYKTPAPSGSKTEEEQYHIRIVEAPAVEEAELMSEAAHGTSFSPEELRAGIALIAETTTDFLSSGRSVRVPGLGIFSISVKADVIRDDKGELQANHIELRGINFRPEKEMLERLSNLSLTRRRHAGRHSRDLSEEELETLVRDFLDENKAMTPDDFRNITGLTHTTAWRRLHKLVTSGLLTETGGRHNLIYRLA